MRNVNPRLFITVYFLPCSVADCDGENVGIETSFVSSLVENDASFRLVFFFFFSQYRKDLIIMLMVIKRMCTEKQRTEKRARASATDVVFSFYTLILGECGS